MVKSHDKLGFAQQKTAHFHGKRRNALTDKCLRLHAQNSRKTGLLFWF